MKTILSIFILSLLVSCGSSRLDRKIDDAAWDSLADESFLRWDEGRLEKHAGSQEVAGCYKGEAKETLEKFKNEYQGRKDSPAYWLHIGNCYFVIEEWSKAEFYYRMTVDDSKQKTLKAIALNNLGLIHFKHEQWEKGKDLLRESMELAPKFKVPRYNLSQLYLQFGLYDKAIEILTESSLKGVKDVDIYFSLANAYLFKGDLKSAAQYFSAIPSEYYRREDIAATYALYLIKQGKLREAKAVMDDRDRSGVLELSQISQKIEKIVLQRLKEE
jgi:tetratricopeptide (TPR) repeat protein